MRSDYDEVVLKTVLRESIEKINPEIGIEIIDEAVKKIIMISHPKLIEANHEFHKLLTDGIDISYLRDN